jgi:hypothetical protein
MKTMDMEANNNGQHPPSTDEPRKIIASEAIPA